MKIYILMSSTGEYSSREEKPIVCVRSEEKVRKLVDLYTDQLNVIQTIIKDKDYDNFDLWNDNEAKRIMKPIAKFIPEYSYPGELSFFYNECELED